MSHPDTAIPQESALGQLLLLGKFEGEPAQFWSRYLSALASVCGAESSRVVVRKDQGWFEAARYDASQNHSDAIGAEDLDLWASQLSGSRMVAVFAESASKAKGRYAVASLKPDSGNAQAMVVLGMNGRDGAALL